MKGLFGVLLLAAGLFGFVSTALAEGDGIVLEGGVNAPAPTGWTSFSTAPITVTSVYPVDVVVTAYNRGSAGVEIKIWSQREWTPQVNGAPGAQAVFTPVDGDWGWWGIEAFFSGEAPIELVVHTSRPPLLPAAGWEIEVSARPVGNEAKWQSRHATIVNSQWGLFLPIVDK